MLYKDREDRERERERGGDTCGSGTAWIFLVYLHVKIKESKLRFEV